MGPRLFSRGKRRRRFLEELARELQWGRDCSAAEREWTSRVNRRAKPSFNGAATVQPRKAQDGDTVDSWRVASMGPRLFSRGKGAPL